MTMEEIQKFLIAQLQPDVEKMGLSSSDIAADMDLLSAGIIDSHGFMRLIFALEQHFGLQINLEDLDFETVYTVKGLAAHAFEQQRNVRN